MDREFRSGFVAIVGRPNVGKSTLMNALIGEKISIISSKPQTTRNQIRCILTRPDYQIIFIDTPGIHRPRNKLGEYMVKVACDTLEEVDAILFVVDVADGIGEGDRRVLDVIRKVDTPVILVVNKIDRAVPEKIEEEIKKLVSSGDFRDVIKVSALDGTNVDRVENVLAKLMPVGPKYYPDEIVTDQPERFIVAEFIREKALELLKEEVPHGIGVEVVEMQERDDKDLIDIHATIYCEKKSHKSIIIGKRGRMLKEIGTRAREDIEKLLGSRVYLDLWVKVKKDWRNSQAVLKTLGYK